MTSQINESSRDAPSPSPSPSSSPSSWAKVSKFSGNAEILMVAKAWCRSTSRVWHLASISGSIEPAKRLPKSPAFNSTICKVQGSIASPCSESFYETGEASKSSETGSSRANSSSSDDRRSSTSSVGSSSKTSPKRGSRPTAPPWTG